MANQGPKEVGFPPTNLAPKKPPRKLPNHAEEIDPATEALSDASTTPSSKGSAEKDEGSPKLNAAGYPTKSAKGNKELKEHYWPKKKAHEDNAGAPDEQDDEDDEDDEEKQWEEMFEETGNIFVDDEDDVGDGEAASGAVNAGREQSAQVHFIAEAGDQPPQSAGTTRRSSRSSQPVKSNGPSGRTRSKSRELGINPSISNNSASAAKPPVNPRKRSSESENVEGVDPRDPKKPKNVLSAAINKPKDETSSITGGKGIKEPTATNKLNKDKGRMTGDKSVQESTATNKPANETEPATGGNNVKESTDANKPGKGKRPTTGGKGVKGSGSTAKPSQSTTGHKQSSKLGNDQEKKENKNKGQKQKGNEGKEPEKQKQPAKKSDKGKEKAHETEKEPAAPNHAKDDSDEEPPVELKGGLKKPIHMAGKKAEDKLPPREWGKEMPNLKGVKQYHAFLYDNWLCRFEDMESRIKYIEEQAHSQPKSGDILKEENKELKVKLEKMETKLERNEKRLETNEKRLETNERRLEAKEKEVNELKRQLDEERKKNKN